MTSKAVLAVGWKLKRDQGWEPWFLPMDSLGFLIAWELHSSSQCPKRVRQVYTHFL
jgi:hypothetical protein